MPTARRAADTLRSQPHRTRPTDVRRRPLPHGGDVPAAETVAQMDGDTELLAPRTRPDGTVLLDVPVGTIRYDATLAGAVASVTSDADVVEVRPLPPEQGEEEDE